MPHNKLSASHEVNHALNAELEFKAEARRNKLLGYWLAGKMGLDEGAMEAYAKEVVVSDLDEPGIEDVVRKIMADVKAKDVQVSEAEVRSQLSALLPVARGQIEDETR